MAAKVGILVIHGMGSQSPGYSEPLGDEVSRRLGDGARHAVWQEIYWADAIADRERRLWCCMQGAVDPTGRPIRLDWRRVREFVVHNFGDAIAYQRDLSETESTYAAIHERVSEAIAALKRELPSPDAPIVVMAHSLGAHIMSNYIWDRQNPRPDRDDSLEDLPGLCSFLTFGCSISLFSLAFPIARPITVPGPAIREPLRTEARWLNFLDRDDVLGWPIRPLYEKNEVALTNAQRRTVDRIEEHEVNAGSLLKSWNPASHTEYWTDDDLTRPVAAHLRQLLAAIG